LSVVENLRFFGGIYGVKRADMAARLHFAVDMAGLTGREDALVATLAGGWKQRLALGAAILHRPAILFLDEPTSGVDPSSRRRFWDLIHTLSAEGVSVLVSTHYMDEAEYCHRIALIHRGQLVALGTPQELKQRARAGTFGSPPGAFTEPTLEESFVQLVSPSAPQAGAAR
jgi:ABC-2 type transport system ATP-binding protein